MEFVMKKLSIKTRITLSLLFAISMASASQRSWSDWSRDKAGKVVESGKRYSRIAYNAARNNPKTAAAIGAGVGALTAAYRARARITAEIKKGYKWIGKNRPHWKNRRFWFGRNAQEKAELTKQEKEYKNISQGMQNYFTLKALGDKIGHDEQQRLENVTRILSKNYTKFFQMQNRTPTEQMTMNALEEWNKNR